MPTSLANLGTIVKVGVATAAGAFFGAITLTALPTTLDGWKTLLAPALGAAIAAELVFLRGQIAAFLAGQVLQTLPPSADAPGATTKSVTISEKVSP